MQALEQAANDIKRDLEGHLHGKYANQDVTIRSTHRPASSSSSHIAAPAPPAPSGGGSEDQVKWCCVCGRTDRPLEQRSAGYKCVATCKGKNPDPAVVARFAAIGLKQPTQRAPAPGPPRGGAYSKGPMPALGVKSPAPAASSKLPAGTHSRQSTQSSSRSSASAAPSEDVVSPSFPIFYNETKKSRIFCGSHFLFFFFRLFLFSQITRFVSMGFTRDKSIKALKQSGGDAQKAADLLLTGAV